jgi:hypothetical protein
MIMPATWDFSFNCWMFSMMRKTPSSALLNGFHIFHYWGRVIWKYLVQTIILNRSAATLCRQMQSQPCSSFLSLVTCSHRFPVRRNSVRGDMRCCVDTWQKFKNRCSNVLLHGRFPLTLSSACISSPWWNSNSSSKKVWELEDEEGI